MAKDNTPTLREILQLLVNAVAPDEEITKQATQSIKEQLNALLPEKVDKFPNKYNEDEMTGWNHAIDQIEKAIEEWAK